MKRLIFPIINANVLVALFGVVGYYLFDPLPWSLVGAGVGLGVGNASRSRWRLSCPSPINRVFRFYLDAGLWNALSLGWVIIVA